MRAFHGVVSLNVKPLLAEISRGISHSLPKGTKHDFLVCEYIEWQRFTCESCQVWFRPTDATLVQENNVPDLAQFHKRAHVIGDTRKVDCRRTWATVKINNWVAGFVRRAL